MACASDPRQLLREAKQLARANNMRVAECPTANGVDYVLYRSLPHQGDVRIGKRSSPAAIRQFVAKCAKFH